MMNGRVYSFLLFLVASAILENIQESHAQHHHVRRPRAYQNDQHAIEQKIDPMMEWTGAHGQVQQKKYFNRTSFQFVRTERKLKRSGKGKGVKKKDATLFPLKSSSSKSSKSFIKEDAAFNQIEDNVNYDIPTIKSLKTPAIKEETETAVATVPWRDLAESGTVVSLDPVDREDRAFYDIGVASYDTPPATVKKNAAFYEIGVASYVAATDEEDAAFYQIGVASYVAPPTTKANNVPKIKASKAPVIKSTKKRNLEESETAAAIIPWRDLTKSGPGVYLFQSMHTLHQEFGVSVSVGGASQNTVIEEEFNIQLEYKGKNPKRIDLLRCQNCMPYDGIWYCGLSENGAAFGLVRQDSTVKFGATKATGTHSQLDILVPVSNDDKKLLLFAERLKPTLKKFRTTPQGVGVDIRVLVTRYYIHNQDLESEEHKLIRQKVAQNADIEEGFVEFVFVSDNNKHFQRAQSINALHKKACHEEGCVVVVVDVDMDVSHSFLINALSFVESGKSAYFPVVWSEYNPETTSLAEEYHGSELPRFSKDKGTWRSYGFGMYAMAGKDTKIYSLDETFMGWGGEDKAFFDLVVKQLNVIRMNEPGLVHVWHPKTCEVGNFVEPAFYHNCVGSKASVEGSQLGLYLRTLKINGDKYDSLIPKISQKSSAAAIVKKKPNLRTNDSILIAVATSRKMLSSRVVTIANTWAKPEALTPDITVLFFVGRYDASSSYQQELFKSGSRADRTILAQQAGLNNFSSIIVMPDAEDDEYPPVYKNTAMLKYLDKFITVQEKDASQQGNTWVFKVDDDTYVNTKGLRDFLQSRESTDEFQIWGERGSGRKEDRDSIQKAGLVKPFCMGGPGYIMSRSLLRETVRTIETCIDNARTSIYKQYIWHSDLIISLCAYNKTGVGCYEASDYYSRRPFRHNYKGTQDFVDDGDLSNIVSMHPFKESAEMMRQHARFLNLSSSKNEDQSLVLATNGTARPLFVLHAGPPKTGTTTIQCTASSNLKSLLQDNVYFLGYVYHEYQSECGNGFLNNEVHKIVACLYEDKEMDTSCATQLQSFLDALEAYRIKNRNVFVSDELFFRLLASGHTDNKALHTMRNRFLAYLGTNWDLRVVVSYRRLHERGPSEYFQIYDKKLENINEKWPERKDRNYKSGRSIPSFLEYHRSGRILTWANKLSRDRMVENLLGDSDFRVDFRIFNIHETNEDLGARFFCEMIPEAKELCQKLEHQETHFRMNQAARKESFVYDRLAVAAFHRGWVDKNASRIDLREAIKKELQKTPSEELPLECLSSEEAVELLDASLALESQLLPDFFDSPRGQPRLRLSFENMLKDHKFCSADVEKILDENKKWETFLRSISRKLSSQQGKLGLQQYYVTRATKNEGDDQHKNISQTSIFKNTIPRDMILLHKKLLWCPNAKAGTSTMYYSILNFKNRTPKNESVWKLFEQNEETRELVRKAPSFTIVRNPWDRLRSCYLNKILGQKLLPTTANPGGEVKTANPGGEIVGTQDKSMSFSAFVRHVEKYPDANVHWQPHSSRCLANANKYGQIFHYDHVVKIEDGLFSQVQEIFELYGLPFPGGDLKKRNAEATSPNVSDDELINFYRQAAATGNVSMKDLVDSVGKIYEHDVTSHRYEFPGYDENKNK